MNRALLEAIDLHYAYPGAAAAAALCPGQRVEALAGASLVVRAGTCLALIGRNGCGKSTLLLHFNGTLRPSQGEVRFAGSLLDTSRRGLAALRQNVALVFQDPDDQLFAGTLAQDVSFGPLNLDLDATEASRRVTEALESVGLTSFADLPLHMLSHGQRKRAAIAGGLAMRPRVLVLDEPTAGLDPEGVETLLTHLEALQRQGLTIVFSTHDIALARSWADEAAIMQNGRVVACGEARSILDNAALLRDAGVQPACRERRRAGRREASGAA